MVEGGASCEGVVSWFGIRKGWVGGRGNGFEGLRVGSKKFIILGLGIFWSSQDFNGSLWFSLGGNGLIFPHFGLVIFVIYVH